MTYWAMSQSGQHREFLSERQSKNVLGMKTPQHHTTPTPKGCLTHSPPHHQHQIPSACCLPGRSLARLTHVSFLTPPMLEPAERRRSQPPPARSLTSSRRSLGRANEAGGRVFSPGDGGGEHQRRPPEGATRSPESADRTGSPGWVLLRLRSGGHRRPLTMLRWRSATSSPCAESALGRLLCPVAEGKGHAPAFPRAFCCRQPNRDPSAPASEGKAIIRKA
ncbi:uncharacterized protein LOC110543866 isoform X1 [Meriones unguiculatus]|uniref:uncharacterized protein LOC110543866 isoform X1 n=1 Tax=Meriones unguiculatus TaxID=10047 RepID=UPI00293EF00C|nr:uncharacterized protein LOC110543866 isoform X1 [Meriones unguiculatus]